MGPASDVLRHVLVLLTLACLCGGQILPNNNNNNNNNINNGLQNQRIRPTNGQRNNNNNINNGLVDQRLRPTNGQQRNGNINQQRNGNINQQRNGNINQQRNGNGNGNGRQNDVVPELLCQNTPQRPDGGNQQRCIEAFTAFSRVQDVRGFCIGVETFCSQAHLNVCPREDTVEACRLCLNISQRICQQRQQG